MRILKKLTAIILSGCVVFNMGFVSVFAEEGYVEEIEMSTSEKPESAETEQQENNLENTAVDSETMIDLSDEGEENYSVSTGIESEESVDLSESDNGFIIDAEVIDTEDIPMSVRGTGTDDIISTSLLPETSETLLTGDEKGIELKENETKWYSFSPSKSGLYTVYIKKENAYQVNEEYVSAPYYGVDMIMYKNSSGQLQKIQDNASDSFYYDYDGITAYLTEGETYYYEMSDEYGIYLDCKVCLQEETGKLLIAGQDFEVNTKFGEVQYFSFVPDNEAIYTISETGRYGAEVVFYEVDVNGGLIEIAGSYQSPQSFSWKLIPGKMYCYKIYDRTEAHPRGFNCTLHFSAHQRREINRISFKVPDYCYMTEASDVLSDLSVTVQYADNTMEDMYAWYVDSEDEEGDVCFIHALAENMDRITIKLKRGDDYVSIPHGDYAPGEYMLTVSVNGEERKEFAQSLSVLPGSGKDIPLLLEQEYHTNAEEDDNLWFCFTPEVTGKYTFYATTDYNGYVDMELYTAKGEVTSKDNKWYDDEERMLSGVEALYELKKGTIYYWHNEYFSPATFKIILTEIDPNQNDQDETEQHETNQDETNQDETNQDETNQDETDQDETDQDETDQGEKEPGEIGKPNDDSDDSSHIHVWGNEAIVRNATALAEGIKTYKCTICGERQVVPIPKVEATIEVNVTSIPLKVKQSTTKLKVTGLAAGDYVKSWESSNTKIVKVNGKGKLTAQKKTGKATITVTLASGLQKKIYVTVLKKKVTTKKITGLPKKLTLKKGKKTELKAVIIPITSQDKVRYTSLNKKIVKVSSKGIITAKRPGKTKIKIESGKKKFTVVVTVTK